LWYDQKVFHYIQANKFQTPFVAGLARTIRRVFGAIRPVGVD
jgi:hypothetical protein